jgi:hypothetical protein
LPSFSKKVSIGVIRSSVQLAKKALKRTDEAIPSVPVPTRSMKYLKANTVKRATETEVKAKMRSCSSKVYPIAEPIKKIGSTTKAGCSREEKRVPPNPAKEVMERTNRRRIRAPLKPRKKTLIQSSGAPRRALIKLPRISIPNNTSEEKKERAEQRLQLKIRSFFMEPRLIIKSESKVRRRKLAPKPRPTAKFWRERFKGRIDRIPPCRHRTPR